MFSTKVAGAITKAATDTVAKTAQTSANKTATTSYVQGYVSPTFSTVYRSNLTAEQATQLAEQLNKDNGHHISYFAVHK